MAKSIEIDRAKRLRDEPHKGHNRWHPDIARVLDAERAPLVDGLLADLGHPPFGAKLAVPTSGGKT